jgi:propanol-preferring alcohol dehydrogenase
MKAMVLEACAPVETAPLKWMEVPDPEPRPNEVRIRVRACGICRTDLHVVEGELEPRPGPVIPGHQVVGTIDRLGPGASRFKPGDRVGIAWLRHTCGACSFCRSGHENLCEASRYTGYHAPGGFAEYAVVGEEFAYPLPPAFGDAEAAPLLCAGIIGYRSLRRSRCEPGDSIALYGFGASAHIVLQIARHRGCDVYVCTRGKRHQDLALAMGATWAGESAADLPADTGSAIIFAPAGPLVPEALARLRKGGTLALAGIYMTDIPAMNYERHLFYEKNLVSVTSNTREDGLDLLREAAEIPVRTHIRCFPVERANEALLELKRGGIDGAGVLTFEM